MKFESLPTEILIACFAYLRTVEILSTFDRLNRRFDQLIRTVSCNLDFHHVHKSVYDLYCQQMFINPEAQKKVCSLRLSNENTPGQIKDFLSKFSLDRFTHLRSLILINPHANNLPQLQEMLPKLSQITAVHMLDSNYNERQMESFIPLGNLRTLSIDSTFFSVSRILPIKYLIISNLSLNEICRLFPYTPSLEYFKVSYIPMHSLNTEYHESFRPVRLKDLILIDFGSNFQNLTHFLYGMSNLANLTICSTSDPQMSDPSHWEQLITFVLPSLINLRFKFVINHHHFNTHNIRNVFERFQTNFWLQQRHCYTECAGNEQSMMIYTIPYISEGRQISLTSTRRTNPLIDHSQTFQHVKKLVASVDDLFKHGNCYFSHVESLKVTQPARISTEKDEERVMESLIKMMSFSHLKHLEMVLYCRTERPSLLFQILQLAPQLSSLSIEPCFLEVLSTQPEAYRHSIAKIKKLALDPKLPHSCRTPLRIHSLYQLIPDLEQLTMRISRSEEWLFLLNRFSKLYSFKVDIAASSYPECFDYFTTHAFKRSAIVDETRTISEGKSFINYSVWIRREAAL